MSLALVSETAKEVRRLAVAGSALSVGDFRLRKLVEPLSKAGEKAPVFGQVAKGISAVIDGGEKDASGNLLGLGTLTHAILFTQGKTSAEGKFVPLEATNTVQPPTRTSARVLKPLVEALTSRGGGRLEIIKDAVERDAFRDLRLIKAAITALADPYPEIADLVAEKVLPKFGDGMAPLLAADLNLKKGIRADARRLMILGRIDPERALPLCLEAIEEGSLEVKLEAIAFLGGYAEHVPLLLEQAKAKNQRVREAALAALAPHQVPEVVRVFTDTIRSKAVDILIRPLGRLKNAGIRSVLRDETKRTFDRVLASAGDADKAAGELGRLADLLRCLTDDREEATETLLMGFYGRRQDLRKVKAGKNSYVDGQSILLIVAEMLTSLATANAHATLLMDHASADNALFPHILTAGLRSLPPARFFEEFSPYLSGKGAGAKPKNKIKIIRDFVHWKIYPRLALRAQTEPHAGEGHPWDSRWADLAIQADELELVCGFSEPGNQTAIRYLVDSLKSKNRKKDLEGITLAALVRLGCPQADDLVLAAIKERTAKGKTYDSMIYFLFETVRDLPKSALPKLDAAVAEMDDRFTDAYLLAIEEVRKKN